MVFSPVGIPFVLHNRLESWCKKQVHIPKLLTNINQRQAFVLIFSLFVYEKLTLQQQIDFVFYFGYFLDFPYETEMLLICLTPHWLHVIFRKDRTVHVAKVEEITIVGSYTWFIICVSVRPLIKVDCCDKNF